MVIAVKQRSTAWQLPKYIISDCALWKLKDIFIYKKVEPRPFGSEAQPIVGAREKCAWH
jgi:hypothetical protein